MGWAADTADPDNILRPLLSCGAAHQGGLNISAWCNPKFDRLLDDALTTRRLSQRVQDYHEAQALLAREMPVITSYSIHYTKLYEIGQQRLHVGFIAKGGDMVMPLGHPPRAQQAPRLQHLPLGQPGPQPGLLQLVDQCGDEGRLAAARQAGHLV